MLIGNEEHPKKSANEPRDNKDNKDNKDSRRPQVQDKPLHPLDKNINFDKKQNIQFEKPKIITED